MSQDAGLLHVYGNPRDGRRYFVGIPRTVEEGIQTAEHALKDRRRGFVRAERYSLPPDLLDVRTRARHAAIVLRLAHDVRRGPWTGHLTKPMQVCGSGDWVCEAHPDKPFPHDDCAGPAIPCPRCYPEPECAKLPPDAQSHMRAEFDLLLKLEPIDGDGWDLA